MNTTTQALIEKSNFINFIKFSINTDFESLTAELIYLILVGITEIGVMSQFGLI